MFHVQDILINTHLSFATAINSFLLAIILPLDFSVLPQPPPPESLDTPLLLVSLFNDVFQRPLAFATHDVHDKQFYLIY